MGDAMHELTIADNIKSMIEKSVKDNSCTKVTKIVISIGVFSNIYKESLEFSLDVVKKIQYLVMQKYRLIWSRQY